LYVFIYKVSYFCVFFGILPLKGILSKQSLVFTSLIG
jgi:hypothetical protein